MHELLKHVLTERDLTRAGDIFAIPDSEIVDDLNEVIKQITEISSRPDYCRNDRDQALIEICVTRVTSCVKETGTLEKYCGALVSLLESCLNHNLMPLGHLRDDDPPHAKIASDIIACIVLVSFPIQSDKDNNGNKTVMELFLPVAVQFLHKGNREISRHMARYLSLAAVHHAVLLKPHVQTIMDSIMSGNYPLCRILTNLYEVCPEPLEGHTTALASLLPHAEQVEKNSLLALFEQIAARKPEALKTCIPQLISLLCPNTASQSDPGCMCIDILQVVVRVARGRPALLAEHCAALRGAVRAPHASAHALALVAQLLALVGATSRDRAQEALNYVVSVLGAGGGGAGGAGVLLREATALCSKYPSLFTDQLLLAVRAHNSSRPKSLPSEVNRTSSGVTIVKLGGPQPTAAPKPAPAAPGPAAPGPAAPGPAAPAPVASGGYTRRAKLGDSRSTGRLHPGPNPHRSMTRLNVAGGSVGGLHKSMTRLSSTQQINSQQNINPSSVSSVKGVSSGGGASGGGVGAGAGRARATPAPRHLHHTIVIGPAASPSVSVSPLTSGKSSDGLSAAASPPPAPAVAARRNNTSVTLINGADDANNHRISVFEPYPMRDAVQHFCEKHLDKIKAYMDNVSLRLPPPAKCTIEERRSKKVARLQFACGVRGAHCLFARSQFSMRTRLARVWVHLMFLALQARHPAALSSRDAPVAALRHCWDSLRCDCPFLTLVTGAFPPPEDHRLLVDELRAAGYFDVFELAPTAPAWGCFLCNHPDRARGFLAADGRPVIEGQLKEKKGRWRLFRRWRTRYFTLSGAHLSCKGSSGGGESIDINQIRSVKVSRGARNIPKAFEIFTGEQTLILKPAQGSDAEQWAQCLSIAVAHSHARLAPAKANSLPARGLTLKSF